MRSTDQEIVIKTSVAKVSMPVGGVASEQEMVDRAVRELGVRVGYPRVQPQATYCSYGSRWVLGAIGVR